MRAYTDYPFVELGDEPYKPAPIREVEILSYDGDKYCKILVEGVGTEVKSGYLYRYWATWQDGEIFSEEEMASLPLTEYE